MDGSVDIMNHLIAINESILIITTFFFYDLHHNKMEGCLKGMVLTWCSVHPHVNHLFRYLVLDQFVEPLL
jgi:hypothetical protein